MLRAQPGNRATEIQLGVQLLAATRWQKGDLIGARERISTEHPCMVRAPVLCEAELGDEHSRRDQALARKQHSELRSAESIRAAIESAEADPADEADNIMAEMAEMSADMGAEDDVGTEELERLEELAKQLAECHALEEEAMQKKLDRIEDCLDRLSRCHALAMQRIAAKVHCQVPPPWVRTFIRLPVSCGLALDRDALLGSCRGVPC